VESGAFTLARAPWSSIVTSIRAAPLSARRARLLQRDVCVLCWHLARLEEALAEAETEILGVELHGLDTGGEHLGAREGPEHEHRHVVRGLVRGGDHELEQIVGLLIGVHRAHHRGQALAAEQLIADARLEQAVCEEARDRADGQRDGGLAEAVARVDAQWRRRCNGEWLKGRGTRQDRGGCPAAE
jgi:hypothetical protein